MPIANYEKDPEVNGEYMISDDGQIKKTSGRSKTLRQKLINTGYYRVDLSVNGVTYYALVHRLVASTFIPNPEKKAQVNHKNGVRTDNRVENLEWATAHENSLHRERVLLGGEHRAGCRPRPVQCVETGDIYPSCNEASRALGLYKSAVSSVFKRNYPAKSVGGYHFREIKEYMEGNNENTESNQVDSPTE